MQNPYFVVKVWFPTCKGVTLQFSLELVSFMFVWASVTYSNLKKYLISFNKFSRSLCNNYCKLTPNLLSVLLCMHGSPKSFSEDYHV